MTASVGIDISFQDHEGAPNLGTLQIPMDAQILINDGQHRRKAIEEALKEAQAVSLDLVQKALHDDGCGSWYALRQYCCRGKTRYHADLRLGNASTKRNAHTRGKNSSNHTHSIDNICCFQSFVISLDSIHIRYMSL